MRVLVACEKSGVVRRAFAARGHDAWSCDLEPADDDSDHHIWDDVSDYLDEDWDLMIAHPPCTHLAVAGARWFDGKREEQARALEFVQLLMDAPIDMICIENPASVISTEIRPPDQVIQPYEYGHPVSKATWLWLKNLTKLEPTHVVRPEIVTFESGVRMSKWYRDSFNLPADERAAYRSETFPGIAEAMAQQWG